MDQKWKIVYYESTRGDKPVKDFIENQEEQVQVKIVRATEYLQEFGTLVGSPHVKKLTGTELWELRVLGAANIRIFYLAVDKRKFLFLHAFKKKTQKTEKKEIRLALKRLAKYRKIVIS